MNNLPASDFDVRPFRITDPKLQITNPEAPQFFEPCSCGCDQRDGKHDDWAGYVRAIGENLNGVSVWIKQLTPAHEAQACLLAQTHLTNNN